MSTAKRVIALLLAAVSLAACAARPLQGSSRTYALIYKNAGNMYGERQMEGFAHAIEEVGGKYLLRVPDSGAADSQIPYIEELIDRQVAVIAIAANDYDLLEPYLQMAMDAGIHVLSFDSAINPDSRMVHVAQADNREIASSLVGAAYEMSGYGGNIAIVSTTPYMDNQNTWVRLMREQLQRPPYDNLRLVDVVYGDDELERSVEVTAELLADYPELDVIVAPTVMGIQGAAQAVRESGRSGSVQVTGLGLPSIMEEYILDGTCPWMYLWNPIEIGYLAGYASVALAEGTITGAAGDRFSANRLGMYEVTVADEGGTEIVLGVPLKFDLDNIAEWKDAY